MEYLNNCLAQLNKGFLELSILRILEQHKSCYGAELVEKLTSYGLRANPGTVYPILNRTHRNGLLDSTWQVPKEPRYHPRRYYQLTRLGEKRLQELISYYEHTITVFKLLTTL